MHRNMLGCAYAPTNHADGKRPPPGPLQSPNGFAADISGYRLQGAVKFTFAAGRQGPAGPRPSIDSAFHHTSSSARIAVLQRAS